MNHPTGHTRRFTCAASIAFVLLSSACVTANAQGVATARASALAGTGAAQSAQAPPITLSQVAASGDEIVRMVDQSRFADLWNSASTTTRRVAQPTQFTSDLQTQRVPLGAPVSRTWVLAARQTIDAEKGAIAGTYLNIEYETRFSRGDIKHELVSFRFDEDRVWRFAGYVLH